MGGGFLGGLFFGYALKKVVKMITLAKLISRDFYVTYNLRPSSMGGITSRRTARPA